MQQQSYSALVSYAGFAAGILIGAVIHHTPASVCSPHFFPRVGFFECALVWSLAGGGWWLGWAYLTSRLPPGDLLDVVSIVLVLVTPSKPSNQSACAGLSLSLVTLWYSFYEVRSLTLPIVLGRHVDTRVTRASNSAHTACVMPSVHHQLQSSESDTLSRPVRIHGTGPSVASSCEPGQCKS
jgi:hypothetical protein